MTTDEGLLTFPGGELVAKGVADLARDAAHSRFNALVRRLVRFQRAAACASR